MAKPRSIKVNTDTAVRFRQSQNLNQSDFWKILGVTQSGGSRYENGRNIPKPVRMLIALAEGKATLDQLKSGELAELV